MKYRFWSSCLLIVLMDQLIKWWVRSQGWYYAINPGAAFSFGSQWPWFEWLVWIALGILIVAYLNSKLKIKSSKLQLETINYKLETISWALLFGGAVSNLIDRVLWGGVVDYVKLWQFPVFNLADVTITIGAALFIIPTIVLVYNKNQHREDPI